MTSILMGDGLEITPEIMSATVGKTFNEYISVNSR